SLFHGILAYGGGTVNGQLGQRNHLGHYLMWGVLAASYLWATRKMPDWLGFICVFLLTAVLGLVNSRTILGYIIAIVLILPFWYWRAGRESVRLIKIFFFAAVLAAVFQFGMGTLLDLL
ncbi:TPA: pilin glycosylation ligase domain-containing protein, partial [Shigella flexneri]|nr:pilin glycosylation ligase domain-containing protein [Shigella flexneri]